MLIDNKPNMNELEKELASVEKDAIGDEQEIADNTYRTLGDKLDFEKTQIPYPNTNPYDVAIDYDDRDRMQAEKAANKRQWDKIRALQEYYNNESLYVGHVRLNDRVDYLIMDSPLLQSKCLDLYSSLFLINVDDEEYQKIVFAWHYPERNKNVTLARNVTLAKRIVKTVDVKLDTSNTVFSNISDAFLRRALLRNKSQDSIQSIIQTIQKKQNDIRSLPANASFAVQGCAGSGKTMVLLHRLRYLLYNNSIARNQFVLLIPSLTLKSFLTDISREFKIPEDRILSYQSYYMSKLGKVRVNDIHEENEGVFDDVFLTFVYSRKLIQDTYAYLFDLIQNQTYYLIQYSDEVINDALTKERSRVEEYISNLNDIVFASANKYAAPIIGQVPVKLDSIEDLNIFYETAKNILDNAKKKYESVLLESQDIEIADDDERIVNNDTIKRLTDEIERQENTFAKASPFTKQAHQIKLKKLKQKYVLRLEETKTELIEEEKRAIAEKAAQCSYVFQGITIESYTDIVEHLGNVVSDYTLDLKKAMEKRDSAQDRIGETLSDVILPLQKLIECSDEIVDEAETHIQSLMPISPYLRDYLKSCSDLLSSATKHDDPKHSQGMKEKLKLFSQRTDAQARAYLNMILFNHCKKLIREKFNITICKSYKHYWYLELYCNYLSRVQASGQTTHVFIDECQDLSISEFELIYKLNYSMNEESENDAHYPVFNVFGDINQMITKHGISDWSLLGMIPNRYDLNENFRNPNQIIDYCNRELPFSMQKVGVEMDDVGVYDTVSEVYFDEESLEEKAVFIVKDEYAKRDLFEELAQIKLSQFVCYTVRDVKGLEFKEVYVIERDMTNNEKYISYTRALVKLNVIKQLGYYADQNEILYSQGDETEEILAEL